MKKVEADEAKTDRGILSTQEYRFLLRLNKVISKLGVERFEQEGFEEEYYVREVFVREISCCGAKNIAELANECDVSHEFVEKALAVPFLEYHYGRSMREDPRVKEYERKTRARLTKISKEEYRFLLRLNILVNRLGAANLEEADYISKLSSWEANDLTELAREFDVSPEFVQNALDLPFQRFRNGAVTCEDPRVAEYEDQIRVGVSNTRPFMNILLRGMCDTWISETLTVDEKFLLKRIHLLASCCEMETVDEYQFFLEFYSQYFVDTGYKQELYDLSKLFNVSLDFAKASLKLVHATYRLAKAVMSSGSSGLLTNDLVRTEEWCDYVKAHLRTKQVPLCPNEVIEICDRS
jgi:hypothetical protein